MPPAAASRPLIPVCPVCAYSHIGRHSPGRLDAFRAAQVAEDVANWEATGQIRQCGWTPGGEPAGAELRLELGQAQAEPVPADATARAADRTDPAQLEAPVDLGPAEASSAPAWRRSITFDVASAELLTGREGPILVGYDLDGRIALVVRCGLLHT